MVYSLFLTKNLIKEDVVIVYGDIVFDHKIYSLLKAKKNILPVNVNWLKNWKKRMHFKNILKDAENLIIKKNIVSEIGTKLRIKKLPKYQFMGIIKPRKNTFKECYEYFKKLNDEKIDMTSFLNLCIKIIFLIYQFKNIKVFGMRLTPILIINLLRKILKNGNLDSWFIRSGKLIWQKVYLEVLKGKKIIVDGDIVRKYITYNLKYSKKDRKKNSQIISDLCQFLEAQGFFSHLLNTINIY